MSRGRLERLTELIREHPFLREHPSMPPPNDLAAVRALVEFQQLRSDLLADHRPLQAGIVATRLCLTKGRRRGWRETVEDVAQEAQSKLCNKLHRADEWRVPAQAIAARCAKDAATEWLRRDDRQPEIAEGLDVACLSSSSAAQADTFWENGRCAVGKAVTLASMAGASLRDAKLWAGAEVVGRSPGQLAEQFDMLPNGVYQAMHRVRDKVLSQLQRELCLSAEEDAVLENEMRARDRRSHAQLAIELGVTATEVGRVSRELRTRLREYLDAMEQR